MLNNLSVFGVEALSRPITDSILSNPEILFKAAIRFGCYQDLEMVAWRKALEKAADHLDGRKLFLNCNPYLVEGPEFLTVNNIFEDVRLDKSNVVLEITERSAITNFEIFYEHLCRYRDCGFQFAVDDVGGGYASLESIVETKPEVVKVDRHIITNIHQDQYKKSIVKFIVAFCRENNILCIAEGIENHEELELLQEIGVDAGQGYFLCCPSKELDIENFTKTASAA